MVAKVETKLKDAREAGKAVLITQEQYAALAPGLSLQYIKFLCSATCERWRCQKRIDERDLKRYSKSKVLIWYQPADPVTGFNRPRLIERPADLPKDEKEKAPGKGANAGEDFSAVEGEDG